ncbi:hypothetical protein [Peribacillus sp. SI8-4]|uniref:hypothetical protein n=1 Tax=Peribacillus sp. SI8-4 TaxID=3048009 RepID=UPI002554B7A5|nr:hypothetical protein [Peribacillus sp. SI8-4]
MNFHEEKEVVHLIKKRKHLYIALILFVLSFILNFPFPHQVPYGAAIAFDLGIPIESEDGIQYVGILAVILLLASLFFLVQAAGVHPGRFFILAVIIAWFAPHFLANTYQKHFASDIYAVSYDRESSTCRFYMEDKTTLHGVCELPFENYDRKDVQFRIQLVGKYDEQDSQLVSLMNTASPYKVILRGKERTRLKIEMEIDLSGRKVGPISGQLNQIDIIMKSGERMRWL